jgi:hypothetical protein
MPLSKELERQANEDIYKSINSIIDRYLSEGISIYDIQKYLKIKKSFNTLLSDINYAGRRYFNEDEDYPGYIKKMLNKIILDKISEVETKKLSENTVKRFSQFLNESAIVIEEDDITPEYLFDGLEYSEEDKDLLASFFKTKSEYVDSKNPKYSVYSITDFQADVLKNNRISFDAMILSKFQLNKMKENIIKKIVSGIFTQIPEQIDYMGIRIKPHTLMDKTKLKESVEKLVTVKEVMNLVTKISKFTYVNKYGEDRYIWKKN